MKKFIFLLLPLFLLGKEEIIIKVDEMQCPMCVNAVKKALQSVQGAETVKVLLETKSATVIAKDGIADKVLLDAVKTTGYAGVIVSRQQRKD